MSTEQPITPEEKIADLYRLVGELENTISYLVQDVEAKAGVNHNHNYEFNELHRKISNAEYHTHHEYASDRHTHDRWDVR
jgi:hypothetical protein